MCPRLCGDARVPHTPSRALGVAALPSFLQSSRVTWVPILTGLILASVQSPRDGMVGTVLASHAASLGSTPSTAGSLKAPAIRSDARAPSGTGPEHRQVCSPPQTNQQVNQDKLNSKQLQGRERTQWAEGRLGMQEVLGWCPGTPRLPRAVPETLPPGLPPCQAGSSS